MKEDWMKYEIYSRRKNLLEKIQANATVKNVKAREK